MKRNAVFMYARSTQEGQAGKVAYSQNELQSVSLSFSHSSASRAPSRMTRSSDAAELLPLFR